MKVTERTLVEMCRRTNNEQLKHWDSGLKVERRAEEYAVLRLFGSLKMGDLVVLIFSLDPLGRLKLS
jgi:hypothetical protein